MCCPLAKSLGSVNRADSVSSCRVSYYILGELQHIPWLLITVWNSVFTNSFIFQNSLWPNWRQFIWVSGHLINKLQLCITKCEAVIKVYFGKALEKLFLWQHPWSHISLLETDLLGGVTSFSLVIQKLISQHFPYVTRSSYQFLFWSHLYCTSSVIWQMD